MDRFLSETENEQFNIRRITKSGFSRSRRKLAPEAFLELNDIIWKDFYKEVDYYGYHGQKLLAVDGTYLNLPNHPSIHEEFDRRGMGRGKNKDLPKSMCLLSALYDPVNYLTLDVQTGPTDGNEQDLLLKHLPKVERGDILLLDRGYPGAALFAGLQSRGIHFIVRMREHWLPVREFRASRKRDTIVTLTVPDKYYDSFAEQFPR
ncbi:transposase [Puia sp. P3]|uniref:transposase n=1 Tax=Puia sp. P3 TaxID=3423952 RepID=UPI003D670E9E